MISPDKRFDVVVIGSGVAGSIAVKELTERGLDVLLLEAGRDITESDFKPTPEVPPGPLDMAIFPRAHAAVKKGQHIQSRRAMFTSGASPFLVNDVRNPYSTPRGDRFLWIRGRQLGGRLHTYGRCLMRMSDYDFQGKSFDDKGANWPVRYDDLAKYYDRVEEFIGVYGNPDDVPAIPDGHYVHSGKLTTAEQGFKAKVEVTWPERRVISWRYAAPNLHRVPLGILAARDTGRLTTYTDAIVQRITVDDQTGRATGAVYVDEKTRKQHTVTADVVMLCASTIESIRLLLNSGSDKHPNGLGNSSGLLGRYFMDQTPSLTVAKIPQYRGYEDDDSAPHDPSYSPAGGVFIPRFVNLAGTETSKFSRGFSFQGACARIPVPQDHPAAGGLMGFGEMLPYLDNRITLHPRRKDAWGVPIARIRCVPGDNENRLLQEQVRTIREIFELNHYDLMFSGSSMGLDSKTVWPDRDPFSRLVFRMGFPRSIMLGSAIHECGGARMGADPATSVLNEHNQTWDVPNLFVTDGSAFASSGSVGPALTIMALTARAAEFIAEQHAHGSLK